MRFFLHHKLIALLLLGILVLIGLRTAPFDWAPDWLPRDPVAADAIPNLGENQQIVFVNWPGRSPHTVEDQVTYPLTVQLLAVPQVQEVRSYSYFGYSAIYLIFKEGSDFYDTRTRVLETLASLPGDTLPEGVEPALGPDATPLGQVFWYTLQGRDPDGRPAPGWDLDELRTIQDYQVQDALQAAGGVAEVASIGGFEREFQVEVDPDALRGYGISLAQVADAIRNANRETGARSLEINGSEYLIRTHGFVETLDDLRAVPLESREGTPITLDEVATIRLGPALRRGALDIGGAEAVGGVVTARHGANPAEVIEHTRAEIERLGPSLPRKAVIDWQTTSADEVRAWWDERRPISPADDEAPPAGELPDPAALLAWLDTHDRTEWPAWLSTSQVTIVPFYDRSGLIRETVGTLSRALWQQVLVSVLVVVVMLRRLRASAIISSLLPLAVLAAFVAMKYTGVSANIVALAGIAIAIGTVVDIGIVFTENVLEALREHPQDNRLETIRRALKEVAGACSTSVATTVISFLPIFLLPGADGRLYGPLAATKTFALIASLLLALSILPALIALAYGRPWTWPWRARFQRASSEGPGSDSDSRRWYNPLALRLPARRKRALQTLSPASSRALHALPRLLLVTAVALVVAWFLATDWLPLGPEESDLANLAFVLIVCGVLLAAFLLFERVYTPVLKGILRGWPIFLLAITALVWVGFSVYPKLPRQQRPPLDEGSFLVMPTLAPQASIGESLETLRRMDAAIAAIPEVTQVVGKIGRVDSPLDPAPVSMIETVVGYAPEYRLDADGRILRFAVDEEGEFIRDETGELVPDQDGQPWRNWREGIASPDDIWAEISQAAQLPGLTGAPRLQPIETRLVMLSTGMRAPVGLKIQGPDLDTLETASLALERWLAGGAVEEVDAATVNASRVVGKPYLEIVPQRESLARHGISMETFQRSVETALGGAPLTTAVLGRQRLPIAMRYPAELRDDPNDLLRLQIPTDHGAPVPLSQVAEVEIARGPMMIVSEDTRLVSYLTFDSTPQSSPLVAAEVVAEALPAALESGEVSLPPGVTWKLAGRYQQQRETEERLKLAIPLALASVLILLLLQLKSLGHALAVFSGVAVAFAGAFLTIQAWGMENFLDFSLFGHNLREIFQVREVAWSTAVAVGFIALLGIATDDGVVMATYLRQSLSANQPADARSLRAAVIEAGQRRVRPCLTTTATTLLALLPVLTATGRGSGVMLPLALPIFGGMTVELLTMFVVPVLIYAGARVKMLLQSGRRS